MRLIWIEEFLPGRIQEELRNRSNVRRKRAQEKKERRISRRCLCWIFI